VLPDPFTIVPRSDNSPEAVDFGAWLKANMQGDPAAHSPGAAPNFGESALPQAITFSSLLTSSSRAMLNPDEAYQHSYENTFLMLKDLGILMALEARKRMVALLSWEIEPEDQKDPVQRSIAKYLTQCVSRVKRFTTYRFNLQDALWTGRTAIQHRYAYEDVCGQQRIIPKPRCHDDYGWKPINGDKLVFRHDDADYRPGQYANQCGIRVMGQRVPERLRNRLEPTFDGQCIFLKPWERDTLIIHKHNIEDPDFHKAEWAGRVHGVGIRSQIYWEWWLKQEALAFLMQYLERSAGGTEIYTYPMNDDDALQAVQKCAKEKSANGKNVIFFPRPLGEDASMYDYNVVENGIAGMDTIKDLVDQYFGTRIKLVILGQPLTSEAHGTGLGSGVADAHLDTLQQIINFDARAQEETISDELVLPIQRYNIPETLRYRMKFKLKTDDDDAKARLESIQSAFQMGARISEKEVLNVIGLSLPKAGDRILNAQGMST